MAPRHGLACESVVVTVSSWRYLTGTWPAPSPAQELVVVVVSLTRPKPSSSTTSFHSQEPAEDTSPTTHQLAPKAPATSHEPKSHVNHPSHPGHREFPGIQPKTKGTKAFFNKKKGDDGEKEPPPRASLFWTPGTRCPFDPELIPHPRLHPSTA
ncbi:hypothetical protein B0T18DRAFT_160133 [Schizothecium vesticola]|uniref:Uncharacterized protein n=1 Tax=Schizothecium vesticola TaxID=314040 RepID=A0AA40K5N1_9PEZI|nr:hypothetical protein B0T18DRAFT_160133 [Schizothecium vesticola]